MQKRGRLASVVCHVWFSALLFIHKYSDPLFRRTYFQVEYAETLKGTKSASVDFDSIDWSGSDSFAWSK